MLLAVNVATLVALVLAALNVAVTPVGNPLAAKVTLELNPFRSLTLIVLTPLPPLGTERLAADAERVKLGTATVSAIVAVLLKLPVVPVIVSGYVPTTAVALAVNVTVLVELVLTGLNAAVTPLGNPVTAKPTLPLKPFFAPTVTVAAPVPDGFTVSAETEFDNPNEAAPVVPVRS